MADRPFQGAKESFRVSNRGTVLVVEDESAIMEMLRVGFTYEGYEVIAVQGGGKLWIVSKRGKWMWWCWISCFPM